MGIKERREREKEIRKTQIFKAGEKLFLKKGIENTTMDEIAEMCELSKGTLYLYFKSKEELYLLISLKAISILYEMMNEYANKQKDIREKLRSIGEAYLDYYKKYPTYFKLVTRFIDHELFQGKPELKDIGKELFEKSQQIWTLITQIINDGQALGVFQKEINPMELAIILWTSSNGIMQFIDHLKSSDHSLEENSFKFCNLDYEAMIMKTGGLIINSILVEKE